MGDNSTASRKKSLFPAKDTVLPSAYLDYFVNGTNYKISYTDFLNALNVIGTIVQAGDPLGVPVLDPQGTVHNIRNIEASVGLKATVSPQNGIDIKTDILKAATGVQILLDEDSAPLIRALVAGNGITLGQTTDTIQINSSLTPLSTKTITVSSISDLPPVVIDTITLADETEYFFIDDVDLGAAQLAFGSNTVVSAGDSTTITITYSGAGVMLNAPNATTASVLNVGLDCPNGLLFVVANGTFSLLNVLVKNVDVIGQVNSMLAFSLRNVKFQNITTNGIAFNGSQGSTLLNDVFMSIAAGTLLDLQTSTFDAFTSGNVVINVTGVVTVLSGAAASANVNVGRLATFTNNRIGGAGTITPVVGITSDDEQWEFAFNDLIKNTDRRGLLYMQGNATATPIGPVNTPVKIAGTWVVRPESGFIGDTTGRLTYIGNKPLDADMIVALSSIKIGAPTEEYGYYFAKNGVIISESRITATFDDNDTFSTTLVWSDLLVENDYIEIFVEGISSTADMILVDSQFRIS